MNIFRIELKRAFTNIRFYIALLVGMLIITLHLIDIIPVMINSYECDGEFVKTTFYVWIGAGTYKWHTYLYFLIFPLIATLPYGISTFTDRKNCVDFQYMTKCGKMKYYSAKYIAVFLSGGCAVVSPLVVNFLVCTLFFPLLTPEVTSAMYSVTGDTMMHELFYSVPLLYLAIYMIIIFMYSGLYATLTMIVSDMTEYRFVAEECSFFIYVFIISFFDIFEMSEYMPVYYLIPGYSSISAKIVFAEMAVLALITFGYVFVKGKRN